jgi:hypothetical protein
MTGRDPVQRALDGATLTHDAYQGGQLAALRDTLRDFEAMAEDLRQRIREIETSRNEGLFEDPER